MSVRRLAASAVALAVLATVAGACTDDAPAVEPGPSVTFITVATTQPTDTGASSTAPASTGPSTTGSTVPVTVPAGPPSGDQIALTPLADGLNKPVQVAWRAADSTLYVVQQGGSVVPVRDGQAGAPVLDVSRLVSTGNEQGLLGLAFHPTEALAYINYTDRSGTTIIAEYAVAADGTFDPASVREVLTIDQPYSNHNGGGVVFGPDGFLYIGMGDGGSANDPERRALNAGQLLGKLLRIDPVAAGGQPYTVPADNPFVGVAGARPEIWSVGLRNPWRFSFDSATGDLWVADVGQGAWEEVNVAWATGGQGAGRAMNFGWSAFEGTHRFNDDQPADGATPPVHEYPHGDQGCSVSGGAMYRGDDIASLTGWFVFADYCSGNVWALQTTPGAASTVVPLATQGNVSAVNAGPAGELYVLDHGAGTVYRIDPA